MDQLDHKNKFESFLLLLKCVIRCYAPWSEYVFHFVWSSSVVRANHLSQASAYHYD